MTHICLSCGCPLKCPVCNSAWYMCDTNNKKHHICKTITHYKQKMNALIVQAYTAMWSGGWLTAHRLYMISSRRRKNVRCLAFAIFAAIAGTTTLRDVWVQQRGQQWWDCSVEGFTEYFYRRVFLCHFRQHCHIRALQMGFYMSSLYLHGFTVFLPQIKNMYVGG